MSKSFAVLGSPISHSKSPAIHQAAYRVLGEDWSYSREEVAKGALKRFIEEQGTSYSGFSVTMPLKENAFHFADETDEFSNLTKATNTLVRMGDRWLGFNTDIFGIIHAIASKKSEPPTTTLIVGSGSTASSAVVAVSKLAPSSTVLIFARNKEKRKELINFAETLGLSALKCKKLGKGMKQAELTISTLPGNALDELTAKLESKKAFTPGGLLLDVAYHPWPSKIASLWSARNAPVTSGLEMLIWQAIAQIRIFKFGNYDQALPNEIAVLEAMRIAVSE